MNDKGQAKVLNKVLINTA